MQARPFWLALCAAAAFSAAAAAQDLNALLAEYTKGSAELGTVEKRAEELVQEHKRDEGQLQDLERNHDVAVQQIETIQQQFQENARQQLGYANQIVENWNSQCAVDRVGALEPAAYDRCAAMRADAEGESQRIQNVVRQQEDDVRYQIEPFIERARQEEALIQELVTQSQRRQAEFDKLKEAADRIVSRLTQIEAQVSKDCTTGVHDTEIELMSFCASLGFDRAMNNPGSFSDVPLQPRPFSATPNR